MLSFAPAITQFLQGTNNFFTTFSEVYGQRKPVFTSFTDNELRSRMRNTFQIHNNCMPSRLITIFRVLTFSKFRRRSFNIKLKHNFLKIRYSTTYGFIVFITNNMYILIIKISRNKRDNLSLNVLVMFMNLIPMLTK